MNPVHVIGVPLDLGADRRGVDMGPSALRIAGRAAAGPRPPTCGFCSRHVLFFDDSRMEGDSMNARNLLVTSFLVFLSMAFAAACGSGGEAPAVEAMAEEAMAEEAPAQEASADLGMLGGGAATLVHEGAGGSPHVSVNWSIDGGNLTIAYGRPYLKGRVVGESVEPMADAVWRLGADEATTLTTDRDLMLGETHVPAGEYTLWIMRANEEVHLIVNSETGQWGTAYNAEHDLAHVPMEVGALDPPAEQLVISIADGALGFEWGALTASVPLMVH